MLDRHPRSLGQEGWIATDQPAVIGYGPESLP